MLGFAAAMLLAATTISDTLDDNQPASELELVFEEEMSLESDDIVFDDSLLTETESDLIELEE